MELRHLRYFVAVAEERHFGRAAERLHMAQPPLSQQIRQLESELGVELLRRTTRRVDLTDAGESYLARAREILGRVEEAGREAQRVDAGISGRLAIGCVGSATYSLLPALSRRLREELPDVDVAFRGEMLVPDQVRGLLDHEIDLALLRPPVDDALLDVVALRRERLVVVLPEGHRLAARKRLRVRDLRDEDFIVHSASRGSVMQATVLDVCRDAGFEARVRHEVVETSTMVTLVAGGVGVALVPEPVASLRIAGATYRPLVGLSARVELAAATRTGDDAPHLARTLALVTRLARDGLVRR